MGRVLASVAAWTAVEAAAVAAILTGHLVIGITFAALAALITLGLGLAGTPGIRADRHRNRR